MQIVQDIFEALNHPPARHAAVVHMPIALAMLGLLVALVSAILAKQTVIRWMAVSTYALLAVSAKFATFSGEDAEAVIGEELPVALYDIVDLHQHRADWIWLYALGVTALLIAGLWKRFRVAGGWLAVAAGLFVAGWVGYVGHLGGTLVYMHGLGTPGFTVADADEPDRAEPADVAADDPRVVFFVSEVRPILEEHCMVCHNRARAARFADLDQTTIAAMLKGGLSGPAIVPGNPAESLIVQAMKHENDLEMPPKQDRLPDDLIAKVERWIRDGAVWGGG